MAFSLHRRPGSPYWHAFFRIPDPDDPERMRQTSKSTKCRKKGEAEIEARKLEEAAKREAGAGRDQSAAILAILKDATDTAVDGNLNEARARKYLAKILETSTGHGLPVYTVREYFDGWLADKEKANSEGTYTRYKGVVDADGNLMNLTAADVRGFREEESRSGKSAATVNAAIKTIRTALNKARREGLIFSNAAEAVELIAKDTMEKSVFSPANIARLLKHAKGDWQGLILAGYYTGANLRDLTELRWQNIDLAAGTLEYSRRKTGRAIKLPLHKELSTWLMEQPSSDDPKSPVFPTLVGKSTAGKSGLSMKFRRIMDAAKIEGESTPAAQAEAKPGTKSSAADKPKSKGRTRNALSFHSLRHSFNSAMANAGVAQETRQLLTGHASAKMNAVYTHTELATLRDAVDKVNSLPEIEDEQEDK